MSKLKGVLGDMPKEIANYHMRRCIDSGLWVTDAKAAGVAVAIKHGSLQAIHCIVIQEIVRYLSCFSTSFT